MLKDGQRLVVARGSFYACTILSTKSNLPMVVNMDHGLMMFTLVHLAESGPSKSGDIAEIWKISPKHASMVLSRCYVRGFVSRRPYKLGRVRGYVYELTDKGAEWLLYKASLGKHVEKDDREHTMEVGNESICPPSFVMLNTDQSPQGSRDIIPVEMIFAMQAMQAAGMYARENQILDQRLDFVFLAYLKASSERDFAVSLYREKCEELKLLETCQQHVHAETEPSLETYQRIWRQGFEHGLECGIKLGTSIGETRSLTQTQITLIKTKLTKNQQVTKFNNANT